MPPKPGNETKGGCIVLTGGGTGGHLYPALAIAKALEEGEGIPNSALLFIGNEASLESRKVPEAGYAFQAVRCSGMPRGKNPFKLLRWGLELWGAAMKARRLLKAENARVVIGTGGYVAAPVLLAARISDIPFIVHESDTVPGLVNRAMAAHAEHVTAAFQQAQGLLKVPAQRFSATGNPINPEIGRLKGRDALKRLAPQLNENWVVQWQLENPVLLVLGGSQGALSLNQFMVHHLESLLASHPRLQIIHQCGPKHVQLLEEAYQQRFGSPAPFSGRYCFRAYFDDMPALWGLARVALCRAGSMTLSELCAAGVPALLVPYPYAAQNHQAVNAKSLARVHAADYVLDAELATPAALETLTRLLGDEALQAKRREALKPLARPNATRDIARRVKQLYQKSDESS